MNITFKEDIDWLKEMNEKISDKELDIIHEVDNIVLETSEAHSLELNHYIKINHEESNITIELSVSPHALIPNEAIDEIGEQLGSTETFIQYVDTNKLSLIFKFD
ncbi:MULTISPECIES: hypothetical protein [Methanobacterium]|uniref:Uncharacterized protein n=2 Tax=Methanobacterium veterum TaxID=408577 RepID=A0A9E5A4A3_9EURY|nr:MULTISPECIES: hypothetical protein [Methanobacterium]MCZ3371228.1 hypothetical protein [Methanobacterium veterum]